MTGLAPGLAAEVTLVDPVGPPVGARRMVAVLVGVLVVALVATCAYFLGRANAPATAAPTTSTTTSATSTPAPGAVDIGFSQDMAVHHDQAVLMAGLAQTRGGLAVRTIAQGILVDQSQETGVLRGWLRLWGQPAVSPVPMAWMGTMPGMSMPARPMPGMASPRQVSALWARSGTSFDTLFLQLMIRHHEGGIAMARYAIHHARLGAVRDAAQAMLAEQVQEIGQMRSLLEAVGGHELPAPG